jgi:ketosteroid isomerase-like protein
MRSNSLEVAERLYGAFRHSDIVALKSLLHPEFSGHVSDGMPFGVGGPVPDAVHMLRVWATVASRLDVRPEPEEFVPAGESRVVVFGHYRGTGSGGQRIEAAFVHDLEIADGAVRSLHQITDTKAWG